jgi:hypothetical protein
MSLLSVLKHIGKDLSHVGNWIDDGLKLAAPIVTVIDPPIGGIITRVEEILEGIDPVKSVSPISEQTIQAIVQAVALLYGVKP